MIEKFNKIIGHILFQNYIWIAIAEISSKGINIILPILIVKYIGLEDFGLYSFAFSLGIFFFVISDIGLTQLFIREVAKNKSIKNIESLFSKFISAKLVFSFISIFLLLILYIILPGKESLLVMLLGLIYISNGFIEFIRAIFRGLEKSKNEAFIRAVYGIITLGILIPYIIFGEASIVSLNVVYLLVNIIFGIILYISLFKKNIITDFAIGIGYKEVLSFVKKSYPFAISTIVVMLYYYIDTIILKFYVDYESIGVYSSAYRIILITIAPVSILVHALFPFFSRLYNESKITFKQKVKKIFMLIFAISLLIFPLLIFFTKNIILLIYGTILIDYVLLTQVLFSSVFFLYLASIFGIALQSSNNHKKFLNASIFGLFLNIILNIFLIPHYSLEGAAIATTLTELGVFILYYYYYRKI